MERRRICCFCGIWANGGIESFLCQTLLRMNLSALQVDIVTERMEESVYTKPLREKGVRFYVLSGSTRRIRKNLRLFQRLLERNRYDAVHLNLYQGLSLVYARLARQAGIPIRIAHSHNSALRRSFGYPVKMLLHGLGKLLFAKDATHRWACGAQAGRFLFRDTFQVIPNGIDTESFAFDMALRREIRREMGLDREILLGNAGRFCHQKNQSFLLDVLARLPENYRLVLAGSGEDREKIEEKVVTLGLQGRLFLPGHVENLSCLMQAMDVYLLPSLFEGFPLTALEAQCAGLPCIFADTLSREIRLTSQVEFMSLDASLWAKYLTENEFPRQKSGREAVEAAHFSASVVAKQIENTYWGRSDGTAHHFGHRTGL